MRYLLLLAIALVSMCAGLPDIPFINQGNASLQKLGTVIINSGCPDALISVEATPTEVKAGRDVNVLFQIVNKNAYNLENINLSVYDPCIFTGQMQKNITLLKGNRTQTFSLKWTAGDTDIDKNCNVKFRISYDAEYDSYQDVAVLTKSEYDQREVSGTLNNIPINSASPDSPLKISLSFSDKQPFIENENYRLYIDYRNTGSGVIDVKNVTMFAPENIKDFECNDYKYESSPPCKDEGACLNIGGYDFCSVGAFPCLWFSYQEGESFCKTQSGCSWSGITCQGNADSCSSINDMEKCKNQFGCIWANIYLNRTLNFIGNRASSSTCSFNTTANQQMDIKSLSITAAYKYILDSSISLRVKRA